MPSGDQMVDRGGDAGSGPEIEVFASDSGFGLPRKKRLYSRRDRSPIEQNTKVADAVATCIPESTPYV